MTKAKAVSDKSLVKIDATQRKSTPLKKGLKISDIQTKNTYFVMLINSTDHVVRLVRINKGAWAPTQLIGRTCGSTDYSSCADAGNYRELVAVNCGSNVQVDVAWQEADGSYKGAGWDSFYADCQYKGGIIQLVNA